MPDDEWSLIERKVDKRCGCARTGVTVTSAAGALRRDAFTHRGPAALARSPHTMKLPDFDYVAPDTPAQVVALLAQHGGDARVIAGGQSLLPAMAFRLARPTVLVDLRNLPELARIVIGDAGVTLGARVRWRDILDDSRLPAAHPLLVAAIGNVAHYQIRNRGTIGGSLAHADPAAEMPCIAVTCDAEIRVLGTEGERTIAAETFFEAPLTTTLAEAELIVGVRLPRWPAGRRWAFREFAQRQGDFALAGIALHYDVDGEGRAHDAHIGVMGGCYKPARLSRAEEALNGRRIDRATATAVARVAAEEADLAGDFHADVAYRRSLTDTLLCDALLEAAARV